MSVDVGLHRFPSHDRPEARTKTRLSAPPSVVELSAEAAEQIDTLVRGSAAPVRVALLGVASWASLLTRAGAGASGPADADPYQVFNLPSTRASAEEGGVHGESWSAPDSAALTAAHAIVIGHPHHADDRLGPDMPALGRACTAVAEAAVPGQTIILASASYVGFTRDLLVAPLERRGFVIGRDIHVAICPASSAETLSDGPKPLLVGGATPECADAAAAIVGRTRGVQGIGTLEDAEAWALAAPPVSTLGAFFKRAIDISVASLTLLVLIPILALIAMAIVMDSGQPILFTQERVGLNGHRFRFRKFRTMEDGAEARLNDVLKMNQIRGPAFQIDDDPRVTQIGRFLRASSLDELPQLWNVLWGDMSLVGPRPAPVVEVAAYEPWHRRRLEVKPGITGLAQVRARSYRDFDQKASLDLEYIDRWSVWLDIAILLWTPLVVFRLTGR